MMETQARQSRLREKLLFRYTNALERGSFETMIEILEQAEQDPVLERMILEVNDAYVLEQQAALDAQEGALVRELVQAHLPSGDPEQVEIDLSPLTIADVVARIQSDFTLKKHVEREPKPAIVELQRSVDPLPADLNLRSIRKLFDGLGIRVSTSFERVFRETAIFLSLGHEQNRAQLAATRRQRQSRHGNFMPHNQSTDATERKE